MNPNLDWDSIKFKIKKMNSERVVPGRNYPSKKSPLQPPDQASDPQMQLTKVVVILPRSMMPSSHLPLAFHPSNPYKTLTLTCDLNLIASRSAHMKMRVTIFGVRKSNEENRLIKNICRVEKKRGFARVPIGDDRAAK